MGKPPAPKAEVTSTVAVCRTEMQRSLRPAGRLEQGERVSVVWIHDPGGKSVRRKLFSQDSRNRRGVGEGGARREIKQKETWSIWVLRRNIITLAKASINVRR